MGLLVKAKHEQAYLKAGIFGDPGSGKTTTACYLAMAIAQVTKKPVAFFETEAGSDFLLEKFEAEKIELLRVKSHSLADLIAATKEAQAVCAGMIIDSITHVWDDVCRSALASVNKSRAKKNLYPLQKLEFQHWNGVKLEWAKWTDVFLNSALHMIVCGRAGGTYDFEVNEETSKKELIKTGTKMRAEGQFGYEPSLLIEMERVSKGGEAGAGWKHCAHVLKDRTDTINGLRFEFEKPRKEYKAGDWKQTFKPFEPVFKKLNLSAEHKTFDSSRTSEELFPGGEGESKTVEWAKRRDIALEEIEGTLVAIWPGQTALEKAAKAAVIETLFETRSWEKVKGLGAENLEGAYRFLRERESALRNLDREAGSVIDAVKMALAPQIQTSTSVQN